MATNFDFLRDVDVNLYDIISDAEKLYRDEYFEQCMGQTRRFAENVCKNVLGSKRTTEETFDQMLATLKDNSLGSEQEKEFIDDLYFLKKCGNKSVHSSSVNQDGISALECLQRAFEIAINYTVFNKNGSKDILNKHYDIQLLATGKKDKSLEKKYQEAKLETKKNNKLKTIEKSPSRTLSKKSKKTSPKKQHVSMKSVPKKPKVSIFWIVVGVFSLISLCMILFLLVTK